MTDDTLSIGEVASRSGIAASALRYYEAEGLVHAARTDGGQRRFDREVLRRLAFIRVAQRVGLTLDEVRAALATLPDSRTPNAKDWAHLSRAWRPRLDEQIAMLVSLREQLTSCIGCGLPVAAGLRALQPRRRRRRVGHRPALPAGRLGRRRHRLNSFRTCQRHLGISG